MQCNNCPRHCVDFNFCSKIDLFKVNIYQLHNWEEPPISGTKGSGTIFFSNCNLKCNYCQNYKISHLGKGKGVSHDRLIDMCWDLAGQGAHNINFVTPTPYADKLIKVMKSLREKGFKLPFVWNCGGYESLDLIKKLEGIVDIYLPDFKYSDDKLAVEYSSAPGYYENAKAVVSEMRRQVTDAFDADGIMQKGLIIRHLALPGHVENSKGVLRAIKDAVGTSTMVSLMSQYCPIYKAVSHKVLGRKIDPDEYSDIYEYFLGLGFQNGYAQDFDSATEEYIPEFK